MSTARLREAAKVLRERAQAATPGEWRDIPMGSEGSTIMADPTGATPNIITSRRIGRFPEFTDAEYIATMHPGVGLALADWLDIYADLQDQHVGVGKDGPRTQAHEIADLILGGESSE